MTGDTERMASSGIRAPTPASHTTAGTHHSGGRQHARRWHDRQPPAQACPPSLPVGAAGGGWVRWPACARTSMARARRASLISR